MSSREAILKAISSNKPVSKSLPAIPTFEATENILEQYLQSLSSNGGVGHIVRNFDEINSYLSENYSTSLKIGSLIPEIKGTIAVASVENPHHLEDVDVAIIKGEWGVSENGAVWLPENNLAHRVLPFITQHLILVLNQKKIVHNLHELYKKVKVNETGFGVLIAGPSKTADIEQSLVIGAHGARSLTVFLL